MKLLLDMNIPRKFARLLTEKGFEVICWSDIGDPKASDNHIMAYALENGFVVVTYDLDFSAILSTTQDIKPSVIQIRATLPNATRIVSIMTAAINQHQDKLLSGAILTIDSAKARIRLLPL